MTAGDIVLVRFPFTELTSIKVRPALVISSDLQLSSSADAVFLMITSSTAVVRPIDYLLADSHPEFPTTGLKRASVFRTDKIHCLRRDLAERRLGVIGPMVRREIGQRLRSVLAFYG